MVSIGSSARLRQSGGRARVRASSNSTPSCSLVSVRGGRRGYGQKGRRREKGEGEVGLRSRCYLVPTTHFLNPPPPTCPNLLYPTRPLTLHTVAGEVGFTPDTQLSDIWSSVDGGRTWSLEIETPEFSARSGHGGRSSKSMDAPFDTHLSSSHSSLTHPSCYLGIITLPLFFFYSCGHSGRLHHAHRRGLATAT